MSDCERLTREVLWETAQGLRTGKAGRKTRIGLTTLGSEVPVPALIKGAEIAMGRDHSLEVVTMGPTTQTQVANIAVENENEVHAVLEKLLDRQELDGVVTMHYPFPIGVATVGKVITPAQGKVLYIATTTGTSDTDRIQAMIKNAVYGIAAAQADGVDHPTVAILNVEGARQVERHLNGMQSRGYSFKWGESARSDGGHILRGNDLIMGSVDVVVTDTLTGNILMKLFSAFTSGGNYETSGYGYGPGIGENFDRLVCIVSRASGTPVIAGAIEYCASMSRGGWRDVVRREIMQAGRAGWRVPVAEAVQSTDETADIPAQKVTDAQIAGIDILELEQAVKALWQQKIYAASGMGCTGPIIMVASEDQSLAVDILKTQGFL